MKDEAQTLRDWCALHPFRLVAGPFDRGRTDRWHLDFVRWTKDGTFGTNRVYLEFEGWTYMSLMDASAPREDDQGLWIEAFSQGVLEWRAFDLIPQVQVLPIAQIGFLHA